MLLRVIFYSWQFFHKLHKLLHQPAYSLERSEPSSEEQLSSATGTGKDGHHHGRPHSDPHLYILLASMMKDQWLMSNLLDEAQRFSSVQNCFVTDEDLHS